MAAGEEDALRMKKAHEEDALRLRKVQSLFGSPEEMALKRQAVPPKWPPGATTMMNPLRFDEISRADCPSASSSFLLPEECTSSCSSEKLQALRKGSNREESAFTSRMKSQGVVCRLVTYNHGEDPSLDIHIHGGLGKPVVVDAVLSGGRAAQSGVQRGDRLLSIDGKKDFTHMSGKSVQASLRPPTTLIFMGFEGRQQSEVRLLAHSPTQVFSGKQLHRFPDIVQLCEETVFEPGSASIFIATTDGKEDRELYSRPRMMNAAPPQCDVTAFFELCQEDARQLVQHARKPSPDPWQTFPRRLGQHPMDDPKSLVAGATRADGELPPSHAVVLDRHVCAVPPADSDISAEPSWQQHLRGMLQQPAGGKLGKPTPAPDVRAMPTAQVAAM